MPPLHVPREITLLERVLSKEQDPVWAATLAVTAVTNFIGNISPETWEKIKGVQFPSCENPDCKCHEFQASFLPALIQAREYFQQTIDQREKEGGFAV